MACLIFFFNPVFECFIAHTIYPAASDLHPTNCLLTWNSYLYIYDFEIKFCRQVRMLICVKY